MVLLVCLFLWAYDDGKEGMRIMSELDTATIEYGEQVPVDTLAREERQRKMSYGAMRSSANNPWSQIGRAHV